MHVPAESLPRIVDCFAELRFYRTHGKELKGLESDPKLRPRLVTMLDCLVRADEVAFSATHLDKNNYSGPYLIAGEGLRFRNFQIRRLLEWHFSRHAATNDEYEIVVDRFTHSSSQVDGLRRYLNDNWRLPSFYAVTAVDSRYVEAVQVADLALRLYRGKHIDRVPAYLALDLSFVAARDVTNMSRDWRP
jgi:hypothetical protein